MWFWVPFLIVYWVTTSLLGTVIYRALALLVRWGRQEQGKRSHEAAFWGALVGPVPGTVMGGLMAYWLVCAGILADPSGIGFGAFFDIVVGGATGGLLGALAGAWLGDEMSSR